MFVIITVSAMFSNVVVIFVCPFLTLAVSNSAIHIANQFVFVPDSEVFKKTQHERNLPVKRQKLQLETNWFYLLPVIQKHFDNRKAMTTHKLLTQVSLKK